MNGWMEERENVRFDLGHEKRKKITSVLVMSLSMFATNLKLRTSLLKVH
jgi:hypothetical protein